MSSKSNASTSTSIDKIHANPESLVDVLEQHRAQGKKIVLGNGWFDLIHVGHVRYLEAAKALGDVLVVAVNTENSIRPGREVPINSFEERIEVIAALDAVDYAVPLDAILPNDLIELIRPDIQAKGTDYTLDQMPEREVVERSGGRIEFVGDDKTHSSTELRRKLRERNSNKN